MPDTLDAVVGKALKRDVSDRYQTAAELASALRDVLEGYGFRPDELRQFVRKLFRSEYAEELDIIEQSQRAVLQAEAGDAGAQDRPDAEPPRVSSIPSTEIVPSSEPGGQTASPVKSGLWTRLEKKLRLR